MQRDAAGDSFTDGCAMYETVGWIIAGIVVALLALHIVLVLGVMSAIQLRDALSRSRGDAGADHP